MARFAEFESTPERHGPRHDAGCVRVATVADVEDIARISAERDGLDEVAIREPIGRDLAAIVDDAPWCVFVAEVGSAVVGYGRVRDLEHEAHGLPAVLPEGWYMNGIVVDPAYRRRGLGAALTAARIEWVGERADAVHYVTNRANRVSIELHARFGFEEIARGFEYPRAALTAEGSVAFRARRA